MLGLFGKRSDHPLANIKSAQQVLEELPKNDAQSTVQELIGWIESIVELADDFRLDHELAVLRLFDDAAQLHLRKLHRDYFSVQSVSKFQENRLWTLLNDYYTHSEIAYRDILTRYRNDRRGAVAIKADLALPVARGIAALSGRLKMAVARYALVEPEVWQHLADYYNHAEKNGYHQDMVPGYPGTPGSTSVMQEFAVLVAWYSISAGALSPLQEHITERLLAHVGKGLLEDDQCTGDALFVFDLAQPTAPMRVSGDSTVHPALRFLKAADGLAMLQGLLKTLEKGIVPDDLYFGGATYEAEVVRDVARRLIDNLTLPLPTRRNPRRNINVTLKVANGFFKVLEQTEVGLNFSQDEGETWEVEDISVTGFRSVLPPHRTDGIKVGTLVGTKPENVPHWGAGIVRRLSRDDKNNLHVGVEVLSTQIVGISLTDRAYAADGETQVAIYLNRPGDTSGEAWLLMKPDTFSPNRSLNMELGGKGYLLLPVALAESGDDYDLARYRRMEQEAVEAE